jgi:hypothetical protein
MTDLTKPTDCRALPFNSGMPINAHSCQVTTESMHVGGRAYLSEGRNLMTGGKCRHRLFIQYSSPAATQHHERSVAERVSDCLPHGRGGLGSDLEIEHLPSAGNSAGSSLCAQVHAVLRFGVRRVGGC